MFGLDGFEVSMFLTEGGTRHAVLSKTRQFRTPKARIKSNSSILSDASVGSDPYVPTRIESEEEEEEEEEEEHGGTRLQDIPMVPPSGQETPPSQPSTQGENPILVESSDEGEETTGGKDEKKPMSSTTYDGFSIYGRVLCLVVKRVSKEEPSSSVNDTAAAEVSTHGEEGSGGNEAVTAIVSEPFPALDVYADRQRGEAGRGMMEDWITMTQIARQDQED